jgi:hypothetical protein
LVPVVLVAQVAQVKMVNQEVLDLVEDPVLDLYLAMAELEVAVAIQTQ